MHQKIFNKVHDKLRGCFLMILSIGLLDILESVIESKLAFFEMQIKGILGESSENCEAHFGDFSQSILTSHEPKDNSVFS